MSSVMSCNSRQKNKPVFQSAAVTKKCANQQIERMINGYVAFILNALFVLLKYLVLLSLWILINGLVSKHCDAALTEECQQECLALSTELIKKIDLSGRPALTNRKRPFVCSHAKTNLVPRAILAFKMAAGKHHLKLKRLVVL